MNCKALVFTIVLILLKPIDAAANHFDELESRIKNQELSKITSVLAQHNNKLIYENYFNGANQATLHDIRSASKSITAILLGQAIAQNAITSEMTAIWPWFANEYPTDALPDYLAEMTFSQLLNMNPPMDCNDWNNFSAGHEERMYLQFDWVEFIMQLPKRGIPPWEQPAAQRPFGKAFSYCTAGVFLVGAAIEQATGLSLQEYAHKNLFAPLAINNVEWQFAPTGQVQGGGGLRIASKDLLKIGQLLLDNGRIKGKQVLPSTWVKKMLQERIEISAERGITYGYLWWVFEFEVAGKLTKVFAASGNGGNYLFLSPEHQLAAVVTSTAFNSRNMHQNSQEIFSTYILQSILSQ